MERVVRVPLSGRRGAGKFALISERDRALVEKIRWHLSDMGYAVNRSNRITVRMHRLIAKPPDGMVVDHINHDRLDNRQNNLRVCTQAENMRNRADPGRGYWFQRQNQNWVVELNGKHIGCFASEEEAREIVAFVRSGGVYVKPEKVMCARGHDIRGDRAYRYTRKGARCKTCQSIKSKEYYARKTKRRLDGVND